MIYFIIIPVFILTEGPYLIRHPKTFNTLASILWVFITGISFLFIPNIRTLPIIPIIHAVAIAIYYLVKLHR